MHASLPELAYSLPAYHATGYEQLSTSLDRLEELGFRRVTFHPTYSVLAEQPLVLDSANAPPVPALAKAVRLASSRGFSVRLEPHLDYAQSLRPPYRHLWRRNLRLDPVADVYAGQVLSPLLGIALEAWQESAPTSLTLGSELCGSLTGTSHHWRALLEAARPLAGNVALGHKVNHDLFEAPDYLAAARAVNEYFEGLDYVAFSFYPRVRVEQGALPLQFRVQARKLRKRLLVAAGEKVRFAIGEFGLGSMDAAKPYDFSGPSFIGPGGEVTTEARRLRRMYYGGLLEALEREPEMAGGESVTFWTTGRYDFLGALAGGQASVYADEVLRSEVKLYNERCYSSKPLGQ